MSVSKLILSLLVANVCVVHCGVDIPETSLRGQLPTNEMPPKVPSSYSGWGSFTVNTIGLPMTLWMHSDGDTTIQSMGPLVEFQRFIVSKSKGKRFQYLVANKECSATDLDASFEAAGMPHMTNYCGQEHFKCEKRGDNEWRVTVTMEQTKQTMLWDVTFTNGKPMQILQYDSPLSTEKPETTIKFVSFHEGVDKKKVAIPESCSSEN